ncbi:hypothetical protein RJ55_00681 [Drechmeria coniospora]|nr:hypothetical protein RJ55_00681 [Drechmeria coniospora]
MPPSRVSPSPLLNIFPSNQEAVIRGHNRSHSQGQGQGQSQSQSNSQGQSQSQSQNPSHRHSRNPSLGHGISAFPPPPSPSPFTTMQQPLRSLSSESGVGPGPGPLRHPRPMTASDLHMQLEKEQEAVVNRLMRELSLLRAAQNASVVSNSSSASATASTTHEPVTEASLLSGSGFSIPTARRHHRNSSSASQHFPMTQLASSYESRHPTARMGQPVSLSRHDGTSSRVSRTDSPGPHGSSLGPTSYYHQQRVPPAGSLPMGSAPGGGSMADQMSPGLMPATFRYEETAFYRNELETAKKENEMLKRRIRELERVVQSRVRSESVSTSASANVLPVSNAAIAGPRDAATTRPGRGRGMTSQSMASVNSVAVGVPEDEVKVGESAASSGLGNRP